MATPEAAAVSERVLSFAVGGQQFGIPVGDVLEVRRVPAITRVPNSSASLAGLMNYQGNAIAVVRMSALLGLTPSPDASGRDGRVVVYGQLPPVGLLVDKVIELGRKGAGSALLDLPSALETHFVAGSAEKVRVGRGAEVANVPAPVAAQINLLAFRVAGQRYALPLNVVAEVLVLPDEVARLPRAVGSALGVLDHRNGVLPLVSVASLLGLEEVYGRRHVLIAILDNTRVGLVTGVLDGVVRIPEAAIEAVPAILQRGEGDAEIDSIARLGADRSLISILSPERLFANREVEAAAVQHSNTGIPAMPQIEAETAELQFVVFRLGAETYGLPIEAVDEIVRLPETLTRVPGAPAFVVGVMNLRGKALPLIDQRRRFDVSAKGERGRVIVVTVGQLQAGFIVDGVSDILRVPATQVTSAPLMPGDGVEVFDRVAPTAEGMLLVVDPKELLDRAERDLLASFKPSEEMAAST